MKWTDYGESSLTLLAVYCGIDKEVVGIPRDSADFKRCAHLIKCLGLNKKETRQLLEKTAESYPEWGVYLKNWHRLSKHQNNANLLDKKIYKIRDGVR